MVQFKALKNEGRIRNVIMASGVTINVYEPNIEVLDKILDIQESWVDPDNLEVREISGVDIIKELFPLLTDLEGIEELTDKEIQDIADNPTLAYIQLQIEIETILTEVYKTHVLSARKNLLDTDFQVESNKVNIESFNRSVALAVKNTGTTDLIDKIEKHADSLNKAAEVQEEKNAEQRMTDLKLIKKDTEKQIVNHAEKAAETIPEYQEALSFYREQFGLGTEEDTED